MSDVQVQSNNAMGDSTSTNPVKVKGIVGGENGAPIISGGLTTLIVPDSYKPTANPTTYAAYGELLNLLNGYQGFVAKQVGKPNAGNYSYYPTSLNSNVNRFLTPGEQQTVTDYLTNNKDDLLAGWDTWKPPSDVAVEETEELSKKKSALNKFKGGTT